MPIFYEVVLDRKKHWNTCLPIEIRIGKTWTGGAFVLRLTSLRSLVSVIAGWEAAERIVHRYVRLRSCTDISSCLFIGQKQRVMFEDVYRNGFYLNQS